MSADRVFGRAPQFALALLFAGSVLAACGSRAGQTPAPLNASAVNRALAPAGTTPIKHVVIIIQENRSFDDLFQGFPGADTASSGLNSKGQTVNLTSISLAAPYDIKHHLQDFLGDLKNQWDLEAIGKVNPPPSYTPPPNPQYGFVPATESTLYFEMAKRNVLADRMFSSQIDQSFVAHQYLIAAQAANAVDLPSEYPWGCDSDAGNRVPKLLPHRMEDPAGIFPCFDYQTLGDELDAAHLGWHYYAPAYGTQNYIWSAYDAVGHIRNGPDWATRVISPETQVLTDVAAGKLSAVTWVVPTGNNSDHPGNGSTHGPQWVASVVNAVGASPYWNSTAIFVVWDDWGGWYDHVHPPKIGNDSVGFRVPMIVISPYAKTHYVSHTQYEFGSILHFTEDVFGLPRLAKSDTRATSPAGDCFDFTQKPRPFHPFATTMRPADFAHAPEMEPPDPD